MGLNNRDMWFAHLDEQVLGEALGGDHGVDDGEPAPPQVLFPLAHGAGLRGVEAALLLAQGAREGLCGVVRCGE